MSVRTSVQCTMCTDIEEIILRKSGRLTRFVILYLPLVNGYTYLNLKLRTFKIQTNLNTVRPARCRIVKPWVWDKQIGKVPARGSLHWGNRLYSTMARIYYMSCLKNWKEVNEIILLQNLLQNASVWENINEPQVVWILLSGYHKYLACHNVDRAMSDYYSNHKWFL